MKRLSCFLMTVMVVCLVFGGQCRAAAEKGVALTIYNDNFAVVKESREMLFQEGVNKLKFTDVASAIDPTSVRFECVSSPGAVSILEQNYEYDLVNTASLLKRYIDKTVSVAVEGSGSDTGKLVSGTLLAGLGNDLILKTEAGDIEIISTDNIEEVLLKHLPDDLVTRPTLVWLARAEKNGSEVCMVTYTTEKIEWEADYSAVLSGDEDSLDFRGWVTIDNKSGKGYEEAAIKLIAGDVRRLAERPQYREKLRVMAAGAAEPAFEEKAFMEYHMYTMSRKSTINNNQVKQMEFIEPAINVPVKKVYVYQRYKVDKVQVKIEFRNAGAAGLGIPLPEGKVRVFKKDPADEMLEFVGEDRIDHTPRDEKLSLYIGNAFDVVCEHTLVDSSHRRRWQRDTHKVEVRNRKDEAVSVFVDERFPHGHNWEINDSTHDYEKRDAYTVRFKVDVGADSGKELRYTVTQTW